MSEPSSGSEQFSTRTLAATLCLLGAAVGIVLATSQHHAIQHWLVLRYLEYWVLSLGWAVSAFAIGASVLDAIDRKHELVVGRNVVAFAIGVLVFALAMFAAGIFHFWYGWFFVALPLAFVAIGWRSLRDAWRSFRAFISEPSSESPVTIGLGAAAMTIGLLLLYVPILNPKNIGYDAAWYHLAIAEQYSIRHGIEPFVEGWFLGIYPQLSSLIYGWAFLVPGAQLFDALELSLHLEFVLVVVTIASIPALARALTGESHPFAGLCFFLFPGVFLYDSNLIGGADHVLAVFAVPLAISVVHFSNTLNARSMTIFCLVASGALLTKYTGVALVLGPLVAIVVCALFFKKDDRTNWRAQNRIALLFFGAAIGLILTSPHWLKNIAFYGNPVFPFAHTLFGGHPWAADSAARVARFVADPFSAEHNMDGIVNTLRAPLYFSFEANDWPAFHGVIPTFGFLFALLFPASFFINNDAAFSLLYAITVAAIWFWYWTFHQARYLQGFMPWMATAVALILHQLWRMGSLVRAGSIAVVALQLLWGAGVPFLPTHAMIGTSPYKTSIDLIGDWRSDRDARIEKTMPAFQAFQAKLPKDAVVLLHDYHLGLGIGRKVISDAWAWQSGIDYAEFDSSEAVRTFLRELGITHVIWKSNPSYGVEPPESVAMFNQFVDADVMRLGQVNGFNYGSIR
ncbi:MAG: hypothetical protein R3A47_06895 [Polyangiales bacterium]